MLEKLTKLIPARLARSAIPIAVLAIAVLLFAGLAVAALVAPSSVGLSAARVSESTDLPRSLLDAGLSEKDSDHDGVSDALENYIYGTDPANWNSSGLGIPDGWLVQYGFDPLSPLTKDARGAAPPPEALPPAYKDGYPTAFTPPLSVYYNYGKPTSYTPGTDAPWWRTGAHADPQNWDATGTGIPIGWLLHYGLDPQHVDAAKVADGSKGNLTVGEAFQQDTDPLALDSDADGLDDWVEIHVTKTDPSKFSTSGAAIADGWLLHYGLDAFDRNVASLDPDRDGLTNLEEFVVGYQAIGHDISILERQGLDPLNWNSSGAGIPDGWFVKYGISPFAPDVERVIARASEWPEIRDLTSAPEGEKPLPDFAMTVRDAYRYGRPTDWNESSQGVWWGGTDPSSGDSDGDGMPDVVEIRGWYANVTTDVGQDARPRVYLASSNPLQSDSDGDGLSDVEEYRGRTTCDITNGPARLFPFTDPRNRDTAFSGLTDLEKVCGATRGQFKYDLYNASSGSLAFDPTKADSAGDLMHDGARLDFWHKTYAGYVSNPRYAYNGSAYKSVFDWTSKYSRFGGLGHDEVLSQFRPDGDVDGDGIVNVLDADPSGGLYVEKYHVAGAPKSKVLFLAGPKMDPSLYKLTEFASAVPHTASDPANPDTDGDGLPDSWEIRYGTFDPVINGWNLDPAKADSNGDGVTDDKANNDADVVTWYAFDHRGTTIDRTSNSWSFDNEREFLAGTDPNRVSTADDGVPDGWKAFWGSRVTDDTYPNLFAARDARLGDVALAHADEIEGGLSATTISPLANLQGAGGKTTGYVRFYNVSACGSGLADALKTIIKANEQLAADDSCYQGQDLNGNDVKIARIQGVSTLTYKQEATLRTNPFLADTDGDGAPDAYEAYYMVRSPGGSAFPDPAVADGDKDPDHDGIGLADECGSPDGGAICGHVDADRFSVNGVVVGAGTDPNAADSDGDGIQDGIEFNANSGLDGLDPSDVQNFRDPSVDTDRDGVPDYKELTGWGGPGDTLTAAGFPVNVRTDPQDPDSDRDGALDGRDVHANFTRSPTTDAQRSMNGLIVSLCSRGIAHDTRFTDGSPATGYRNVCGPMLNDTAAGATADLVFTFVGEATQFAAYGVRPDIPSTVTAPGNVPVPDGWIAYYHQDPRLAAPDVAAYVVDRPSWWSEATMGVWWCGQKPGLAGLAPDLDADGLRDGTGEDLFPSLHANRYNGTADPRDPSLVRAYVKGADSALGVLKRAQALCDGPGDPAFARDQAALAADENHVRTLVDRAPTAVIDLALPNGTTITKGVAFPVTGRVVIDARSPGGGLLQGTEEDRIGVANRTVLIGAFGPDRGLVLGAGFTNATGAFNLTANITSDLKLDVPAGLVARGITNGTATVHGDPSTIATGVATGGFANTIVAWVTNASANVSSNAPTYGSWLAWLPDATTGTSAARTTHGTAFSVSTPIPVSIRADTRFTTTLASDVDNGAALVGDLTLQDASGALLGDRNVRIRWTGAQPAIELSNTSTDHRGVLNLTNLGLRASVAKADTYALVATFTSSDADLGSVTTPFPIAVRDPTQVRATLDRASATVGDVLTLQGTLTTVPVALSSGGATSAAGAGAETVHAILGDADVTMRTDDHGAFSARIAVPGTLPAGAANLAVRFAGTSTRAASELLIPVAIQRTAIIDGLNKIEGPRSIDATLIGALHDNEGTGFAGAVVVETPNGRIATGAADDKGAFSVVVPLSRLQLGSQSLTVRFLGDGGHAPAANFTTARVTSTTTLAMAGAPASLVRGTAFPLVLTLLDDAHQPVPGTAVAVSWRGERVATLATDAAGQVRVTIQTNASERPALAALGAEALPQASSVYQPTTAEAAVRVLQGTTLQFAERSVARGAIAITGRVLDDEGRPLVAAPVDITFDGKRLGIARTARNGTFELDTTLAPTTKLGSVIVVANYTGTDALAASRLASTWHVRSPLVATFTQLGPFVRGEGAPIGARITDDQGASVDADLVVTLADRSLGTLHVGAGSLNALVKVPADLPRGATQLAFRMNATDAYDDYARAFDVVIKIPPKVSVDLPALAVRGFSFTGTVTLKDDKGEPLRNTTFVYLIGDKTKEATFGQTDAEGKYALAGVAPLSGNALVTLTVRGGADVVAAEYRAPTLHVIGPATPIGYAGLVIGLLVVLAIVAVIVVLAILRKRQLEEVRQILDDAIRDLMAGNEYTGTIFLAYRKLSAHLAKNGYSEQASQTPREFAIGVRKALPIRATPLKGLVTIFEEAKYSDHPVGSRERDRAVEDLTAVRAELDRVLGKGQGATS